ncbi:H+-translocating inorganic pyrophosphatase TVP1, putative [Perkinsus marinus ATCC 50983]|uniref:H(+)-exporting diphosphatase n=2 Tax=Perkinsus marinus (strain ATCC 50983 / TXsc) TaxID=423536 RepID=C5KLN1_PERM5|nr:H+-translocating inorganic pyrophosphatase TVP1, putative [Perkinsus marinus ATCC 50983]EER14611.1 H+-translocating inorganic pyrophosphatase TVP1, putative [Perkinsus marinus ATCC 50983]|eukprot:XP_002782815.1 H+-translocating inorganic pyrophosphatase TVP1, putative [Perkinsus marinus ATCC 50983]
MSSVTLTNVFSFVPPVVGLLWAIKELVYVRSIKLAGPYKGKSGMQDSLVAGDARDVQKILLAMREISSNIAEGANAFLIAEYKYMMVYVLVFSVIIWPCIGFGTMLSFVVGSITSIACGYIGMKTAVYCNVRTAHECWKNLSDGYDVALRGGSVMGFALVSLAVLNLAILVTIYNVPSFYNGDLRALYEALTGYGLGGSSIALFGRVGGGIYTKAADVGADLSGKNEYGLDEDDPRNPGCIADNVGDNVGDIAGMGADLFGSFAESTCAAMVICSAAPDALVSGEWSTMLFPLMVSSVGILVGLVTMLTVNIFYKVKEIPDIEKALKGVLVISTLLQTPTVIALSWWALPAGYFAIDEAHPACSWIKCAVCILLGLWSGLCIGYTTEYYTSQTYKPVREIAESEGISAATGIIYGLAAGYVSCIVPVICLAITICVAHSVAGMFGVALGALGMLGTLTMSLTIDAYGPISDNAGGIAEMSELGPEVRELTDALDAAGNTTAAIGKGFAIGSAALVSLALFGAYTVRAEISKVNILDPWTFTGLLFGAMMPYAFSAMTMKSVGKAANQMVEECMSQFPKIISGEMKPNYTKCIKIATDASLMEMIAPGCLVILSPLVAGLIFGKNCTAGLLCGALVSGVQMAISMSNTGGAWDNAKKYIESGGLGPECGKGSQAHKNAVTGDTVGDPLKDTSGPAINIVIKLSAIMSLVFGGVIAKTSNENGGPFWL